MIRNLLILLASLTLFWGCMANEEKSAEGEANPSMTEESSEGPEVYKTTVEVVTLNDTLESPRREMMAEIGGTEVTVNYGSPSVKEREIWGELVPYEEVWRTGANEATVFTVGQDVKIEGQTLPAGKYGLFTIPGEKDWTIIFNETAEQWGAYEYDESKDVLRVKVKPETMEEASEKMEFTAQDGQIIMMWENVMVPMSVEPA